MANGSLSLTFSGEMNAGQNVQAHRPSGSAVALSENANPELPLSTSPSTATTILPNKEDGKMAGMEEEGNEKGEYYIEGVDDWRDGFYEPMGYHTGGSGTMLHGGLWGTPRLRQHIWDYCPEVKMTLAMDVAQYVPGDCMPNWKRDGQGASSGSVGVEDFVYGTDMIDGAAYPMLPPTLVPW